MRNATIRVLFSQFSPSVHWFQLLAARAGHLHINDGIAYAKAIKKLIPAVSTLSPPEYKDFPSAVVITMESDC